MPAGLTADAFSKLLLRLDANQERAGHAYEDLRRKLIRFFQWRSAPFPEEHADEVLNRLAKKISEGVEVKNVGSYCHEIARLVLLEAFKTVHDRHASLDEMSPEVIADSDNDVSQKEIRLVCL